MWSSGVMVVCGLQCHTESLTVCKCCGVTQKQSGNVGWAHLDTCSSSSRSNSRTSSSRSTEAAHTTVTSHAARQDARRCSEGCSSNSTRAATCSVTVGLGTTVAGHRCGAGVSSKSWAIYGCVFVSTCVIFGVLTVAVAAGAVVFHLTHITNKHTIKPTGHQGQQQG